MSYRGVSLCMCKKKGCVCVVSVNIVSVCLGVCGGYV